MRTKRTTKRTTQAFATPMTGAEAFAAGRREYETVSAGSAGATPAAPAAAPSAPESRCERTMTKPASHLVAPKRGRSKGRVIGPTN
jgi:hypothetical protein